MKRALSLMMVLLLSSCSSDEAGSSKDGGSDSNGGSADLGDIDGADDLGEVDLSGLTIDNYPAVDGSTSAHPLGMLVACKLLGIAHKWDEHWDSTKRIFPDGETGDPDLANKIIEKVAHNGTHSAYVNLIEKKADLILVARMPSDDELAEAKTKDVTLETRAIALDAFVLILNHQNPVDSLTVDQIRDIYTGKIARWDQVGGPEQELKPYQRNENSGSQELMKSMVMKELTMIDAPDMVLEGMMGPINQISEDKWGLGYSVYFFEQFMAPNEKLKLCGVNAVVPSFETIQAKKYELFTEVYAVIRGDTAADSNAHKVRDWLLSAKGQAVIKESGYVPLS